MPELETPSTPVTDNAPVDTAPVETPASNDTPSTEAASPATSNSSDTPQATDPAVVPGATPDDDTPDHGVNPDKGIDPDAGDVPVEVPKQTDAVDVDSMTEQQKASYFHQLRNSAKKSTEDALNAKYQAEKVDDVAERYKEEGYDDFQAQMLAREEVREQEKELATIRADIAELNAGLTTEAVEVVSSIPWLNPKQKEAYGDGQLANLASQLYENYLVRDERTAQLDQNGQPIPGTGQIIEAKLTPMQFYGALDQIRASGTTTASVQAQRNAEKQMASVAPPTSTTVSRGKEFEAMSASEKREYLRSKGHDF